MDILALDFDGVICDSAGETGTSGWKAACRLWPDEFRGDAPGRIVDAFRLVRPELETGYESILLVRMLKRGVGIEEIRSSYHELRTRVMTEIGLDADELVQTFGTTRDDWMREDLDSWLAVHRFYPGVIEAINRSDHPVYIITTKERRFAVALVRYAGLEVDEENVYGLESGRKLGVLANIHRRAPKATVHFVEDRFRTLQKVKSEAGGWVQLYLAPWGYVTAAERGIAESTAGISILELDNFGRFAVHPSGWSV